MDGEKSLPEFQGKNSPFIFAGKFLIVNSFDAAMIQHIMTPSMQWLHLADIFPRNPRRLSGRSESIFIAKQALLMAEKE